MTIRPDRGGSALGRGLASLIPQRDTPASSVLEVPLSRVVPNPHQPRHHWDDADLADLAASIREHGVLQPVLVTETLDGYQLIAGERRVRAARLAGLERIPALVRQLADRDQLEVALVENVQRSDLDPIDEALAYRQLIDEFGLTQERVADRVGKARATVANTLRLLDLHPAVQAAIGDGRITEGHGRALGGLPADGQAQVLGTVVGQGLSVRQTEELVRRLREPRPVRERRREAAPGRRAGAGRGGPSPAPGDQGEPQPVPQGGPHRHRVLQRRGARTALRSPDRRTCVTDVGDRQRPAEGNGRAAGGRKTKAASGQRVRRLQHPGARGPRGRPASPGHVHRLDGRTRPAPPRLGGRRQLDRRGDGRLRDDRLRHDPPGRQRHGRGRRPGRAGRAPLDRQGRPRGRAHGAPRRRQVRRRRLQGLRRPARRRRVGRERPLLLAARRDRAGRRRLGAGVRARQAHHQGGEGRPAGQRARAPRPRSRPTPRCSRPRITPSSSSRSASASRPTSPRASGSRSATSATSASGPSTSRAAWSRSSGT